MRRAATWEGRTLEQLQHRWDRRHVYLYARVDSTNTRARQLAAEDAPAGTIVLADEQTAGRGVAARRWASPKAQGLYLSLLLRPRHVANPLLIPLLAGLGVARAAEQLLGGSVGIKWPNDIVVRNRKAGGVLSEASWSARAPNHVVLGIGVNVHQKPADFPPELREVAISLDMAAGRRVSRLELADLVLREIEPRCASPEEMLDRETLRLLDERDWLRDRRCTVLVAGSPPLEGTAAGIAPDGALLFRPDHGALERVTTGRVLAADLPTPDY
jgi:BirA family biotin operon repressor/biotin-[acetyl-CoA-carboxylase] ligase